ncbi:MAG: ATP-binding protein [Alphaproteobacteria bacterium]|nr:ATP-binding protein [Alphaproteobacteria bacterium]
MKIHRTIQAEILKAAQSYPVVTIIGPRQSGKTTLVKTLFPEKPYISLEDPDIRLFATEDPRKFLETYPEGAILDEVQRVPQLLSYIQGIVDLQEKVGLFILTGSHQLALQESISQSLAGRTALLNLMPLTLEELKHINKEFDADEQIFYGFYPRLYKTPMDVVQFYRNYIKTYVERDVKLILNIKDLDQFQRLLSLCATRIGQMIDYTQLANELGISRHTVVEWISILKASFIVTILPPYFENLGKRIVKTPKLYFCDVGIVSYLLGIRTVDHVAHHPLRGYLFENMIVNELVKNHLNLGEDIPFYFYRDTNQIEVDVVFQKGLELIAVEIKSSKTFNKNFLKNINTFKKLSHRYPVKGYVVYTGDHEQVVDENTVINYKNFRLF